MASKSDVQILVLNTGIWWRGRTPSGFSASFKPETVDMDLGWVGYFMCQKFVLMSALLMVLIFVGVVLAEISVGVKKGDWIEYKVTFTGTPPPDHDITWARMEIVDIQGKAIDLDITTEFSNGTLLNETITLNLETGKLGDDFIIPANLNKGDAFLDKYQGNIARAKP